MKDWKETGSRSPEGPEKDNRIGRIVPEISEPALFGRSTDSPIKGMSPSERDLRNLFGTHGKKEATDLGGWTPRETQTLFNALNEAHRTELDEQASRTRFEKFLDRFYTDPTERSRIDAIIADFEATRKSLDNAEPVPSITAGRPDLVDVEVGSGPPSITATTSELVDDEVDDEPPSITARRETSLPEHDLNQGKHGRSKGL
jgi:hypothetical protein